MDDHYFEFGGKREHASCLGTHNTTPCLCDKCKSEKEIKGTEIPSLQTILLRDLSIFYKDPSCDNKKYILDEEMMYPHRHVWLEDGTCGAVINFVSNIREVNNSCKDCRCFVRRPNTNSNTTYEKH